MRTFIDGNGNDSSAAARQYLSTHRGLTLPDLYVIYPSPALTGAIRHPVGEVASATLYVKTTHTPGTPNACFGVAEVGLTFGESFGYLHTSGIFVDDNGAWVSRTDSSAWNPTGKYWTAIGPDFIVYENITETIVSFYDWQSCILGCDHENPFDEFTIEDCYIDVTYVDGSTARLRPTTGHITDNTDSPQTAYLDGLTIKRLVAGHNQGPIVQFSAFVDERDIAGWSLSDLVSSGTVEVGGPFLLTDYPSPLTWDYKGEFAPAVIARGEVESKIGFEADTLDITWSPQDTDALASDKITALAAFGYGMFDNGVIEVWRACMPQPGDLVGSPEVAAKLGDCNSLGACLMFSGRIGDIKPNRAGVTLSVVSRMDNLNIQVPTNLIEPTNVYAAYSPGVPPVGGSDPFTVAAGTTTSIVYASESVADGLYTNGYIVFSDGDLKGFHARIIRQSVISAGSPVVNTTAFYLAESLPFAPEVDDTFVGYVATPLDDSGDTYGGFRWVPAPDNSAVII